MSQDKNISQIKSSCDKLLYRYLSNQMNKNIKLEYLCTPIDLFKHDTFLAIVQSSEVLSYLSQSKNFHFLNANIA